MIIKLKLYASLGQYLPEAAVRNEVDTEVNDGVVVTQVLADHKVPGEMCHLVLINGNYLTPGERETYALKAGDSLAVWPPVAGG